jgi:hypothetical protein
MGQTPDQLRHQIEQARGRLGQDLNELEYSVRSLTEWRTYYRRYPWAILAGLFTAGLLAGLSIPPRD